MATSGTISKKIGTNSVYTLWIDWVRNSKSDANNTSNITVTLKAKRNDGYPSYGAYNNYGNNTIKLTVGEAVKVNNTAANIDLRTSTGVTLATWTGDVAHNSDGTLNLALEGYFYFNSSAASSLPKGGYTVSGIASLDTIPRKSSVSCTDANVGSSAVITINSASTSFRHTLTYSFGSLSGTIVSKTANTSIGWTLPETFYGQMPKRTLKGTITCETFDSSGNSLGTSPCDFTATAVDTVTVSGSVVDTNDITVALTGDSSKLIKYFSTAKATISASTNNSATISSKTINGADVESDKSFPNCETASFVFAAKDSRDYSDNVTVKPEMIQYIKLTNNASVSRVSPTGDTINLSLSGNYFNGSFGAAENTLTCKYRYCVSGGTFGSYQTVTAVKSGNGYSFASQISGFDYQNIYTIEVVVSDALMDVQKTLTLYKGMPVFDWGEDDFNFNVPAKAPSIKAKVFYAQGDANGGLYMPSTLDEKRKWWLFNYIVGSTDYKKFVMRSTNTNGYYVDYSLAGKDDGDSTYTAYNILTSQDLEYGTWTPKFVYGTFTYTAQSGSYFKIGKMVYIQCELRTSAATLGSNGLIVGGVPFTPAKYAFMAGILDTVTGSINYRIALRAEPNSSFIRCLVGTSGTTDLHTVTTQYPTGTASVQFSGWYQIA